ncbi:MAG TPA: ABC transporter permease [Terriglobia bacterium]|nr:ABC transporter permease [Terriglobia bacterium]
MSSTFLLGALVLWKRELVRFFRERSRIGSALGSPLIFWLMIGSGVGSSFVAVGPAGESMGYLEYFFPGTVLLVLLFTAIFSTISIIEDRKEGFLQAVLISPIPRSSFVLGKLLGGTSLAMIQGALFMLLAPLAGIPLSAIPSVLVIAALVSFGLTALGYIIAWKLDSTQGFHGIMMLLLLPMWFLSGAVFQASTAPAWLRAVVRINPVAYGLSAMRWSIYGASPATANLPGQAVSLAVSVAFTAFMFGCAILVTRRPA